MCQFISSDFSFIDKSSVIYTLDIPEKKKQKTHA